MTDMNKNDPNIEYIRNYFFEVYKIKYPIYGYISLGYFNAFKSLDSLNTEQKTQVKTWLVNLFNTSSIVAGDFNTIPKNISDLLKELSISADILSTPSYLFPKEDVSDPVYIPSFDNFVIFDTAIEKTNLKPLIKLPEKLNINPRKYMHKISSPSDHVPVIGSFTKQNRQVSIGVYNVADPVFWGDRYPSAKVGFDTTGVGEKKRTDELTHYINQLINECDLVFLSEVPSEYSISINDLAVKNNKQTQIKEMAHIDRDSKGNQFITAPLLGVSNNILIFRS